jgi:undecaprenyl diphosphate synthase
MIPKHIAVIMDGNGRWAKAKGKPRTFGHKKGSETLKQMCKDAYHLGVEYVTVYAFSTENWKRSEDEVSFLMNLLRSYLKESIKNARENNMKVRVIGRRDDLAADIKEAIIKMEDASKNYTGLNLIIALNYGGRDEIVRGMKTIFKEIINRDENKQLDYNQLISSIDQINETTFSRYLDTGDLPEPDLLIRTSGEHRTSNFLPWQLAYTEFYFTDKHWPDFDKDELKKAIEYYEKRDRRFGGVKNED